jgi:hypothetical protein
MGSRRPARTARSLAGRLAGWIGADGNPLRRRTDRVESTLRVLLVLAFLAGGPLLASQAGRWTQALGQREIRRQHSWQQVDAVLLQVAPQPFYSSGSMAIYWVPGRWQAPSGARRIGEVPTPAGLPAGASVRIWVNDAGRLTGHRPLTPHVVALRMVLAELAAAGGLALALLIVSGLARWQLNRRRLANWAMEWAAFGPRWTMLH